ncbi:MAG: (S)-2-haloacid dehalogenase [Candidatus Dichloromethanomonas elyunquensis]|nr:MAG: (S)-2-haloacid dehalogenase [Candidatus Dichloromethanomonas elyunquensis]
MIRAVVFDAYNTLYNVNSVIPKCEEFYPGWGTQISLIWRTQQLQYSWQRSLMGNYRNFWVLTVDGLRYALEELRLPYNREIVKEISNQYYFLRPYPDVTEALNIFFPRQLAILSNGTADMLHQVVKNNDQDKYFQNIISADAVKIFKPAPEVYGLAAKELKLNKKEILFVSSNGWDIAGAKWYGYITGWINRTNSPIEKLGVKPDYIVSSLLELALKTKNI